MSTQVLPSFRTVIAKSGDDLRAAQRLRYAVFVEELGGDGPLVDHVRKREQDRFDPHAAHLLLCDDSRAAGDQVVGVYRLMTAEAAAVAGQYYCEDEYELSLLRKSGLRLLELGRSCLHRDYRGGTGMAHMWSALAEFANAHQIDILFGVASFHGTDTKALASALSLLHHRHLAPVDLRVKAKGPTAQPMDMVPPDQIDRIAAVRDIPALIKAYLRLGGTVGAGAFVDHAFNTVDVCMILRSDAINALRRSIYAKGITDG